MDELKAGDVVRLKSGGPSMTITGFVTHEGVDVPNGPCANCTWFDGGQLLSKPISRKCLENVAPEKYCGDEKGCDMEPGMGPYEDCGKLPDDCCKGNERQPAVEYRPYPYGGKLLDCCKVCHVTDVAAFALQEDYDGFVFNNIVVRAWKGCTVSELVAQYERLHEAKVKELYRGQ